MEDECYLIDLLDTVRQFTRIHDDGSRYTAIAFKSNETAQYYALTSHLPDAGELIERDSTLRAKNFFIYREISGRTTSSVADRSRQFNWVTGNFYYYQENGSYK